MLKKNIIKKMINTIYSKTTQKIIHELDMILSIIIHTNKELYIEDATSIEKLIHKIIDKLIPKALNETFNTPIYHILNKTNRNLLAINNIFIKNKENILKLSDELFNDKMIHLKDWANYYADELKNGLKTNVSV